MGDYAIVGEGITDQIVLRSVILAFHDERDPEPMVVFEHPPLDTTGAAGLKPTPGGWTLVVRYLRDRRYLEALQLNRYVVIQIDSDIAGDLGVPRPSAVSNDQFIDLIIQKLCSFIAHEDLESVRDRLLFAVGFDEIECWLLPVVFDRSEKIASTKVTGCLEAINNKLRTLNQPPLSTGAGKIPARYRQVAAKYRRQRDLQAGQKNPGFTRFLRELSAHPIDPDGSASESEST